jgi:hypothetical protein
VADQLGAGRHVPGGLGLRNVARHVDDGGHVDDACRGGHAEPVVAPGRGDHAVRPFPGEQRVQRAAELERPAALQVFELQHQRAAVDLGAQDRGAPDVRGQAAGGRLDVGGRGEGRHVPRMRPRNVKLKFDLLNEH